MNSFVLVQCSSMISHPASISSKLIGPNEMINAGGRILEGIRPHWCDASPNRIISVLERAQTQDRSLSNTSDSIGNKETSAPTETNSFNRTYELDPAMPINITDLEATLVFSVPVNDHAK